MKNDCNALIDVKMNFYEGGLRLLKGLRLFQILDYLNIGQKKLLN